MSSHTLTISISEKYAILKQPHSYSKDEKKTVINSLVNRVFDFCKNQTDLRPNSKQIPESAIILNPKYNGKRITLRIFRYKRQEVDFLLFNGYRIRTKGIDYYVDRNMDFKKNIKNLMSLLNGNRIELVQWYHCFWKSNLYWDPISWKTGEHRKFYEQFVYPIFRSFTKKLLTKEKQNILEVCSGDGELARKLFDRHSKNIESYHLLDLNEASQKIAKKNLSEEIELKKACIHSVDIVEADYLKLTEGKEMDLVIGCGALNYQVLQNYQAALTTLSRISAVLKLGGVVLLSGWTAMRISSVDLEKYGFKTCNKMFPGTFRQFYVATKQ